VKNGALRAALPERILETLRGVPHTVYLGDTGGEQWTQMGGWLEGRPRPADTLKLAGEADTKRKDVLQLFGKGFGRMLQCLGQRLAVVGSLPARDQTVCSDLEWGKVGGYGDGRRRGGLSFGDTLASRCEKASSWTKQVSLMTWLYLPSYLVRYLLRS
jgi:hypothetical protein